MLNKVLVINTGGTIGMIHSQKENLLSPLRPSENWDEIAGEHSVLNGLSTDYYQFNPLIDSSDMNPEGWVKIAKVIEENYEKYNGFVILHGTDTMAYTASALSFMLKELGKPVIITGAQVPLQKPRSDALQNLVTAIHIAGNDLYGVELVPEVCIFFRDTLLRGNRSSKNDARNYFGFSSPNYPVLGEAGAELDIRINKILEKPKGKFHIDTNLDNRVIILDIFPGLKPSYLRNIFESIDDIKGVILKSYGNGNAPTSEEFLEVMNYIASKGIVIVNITQCPKGSVKMGLYEASTNLIKAGVVSGSDLTPEAALTKLMYLLGKTKDTDEVKKLISLNICGEQTSY
jgi:L-asparaginase